MLNKLYEWYKDDVAFYVVYIQEAHPVDAWHLSSNEKEHIFVTSTKTFKERCDVAETCATKLNLKIPSVIDDISNSTDAAYTAWPDRLYVIDQDGRIAYKSKPGPYGFKPLEVAAVLHRLVPHVPRKDTAPTFAEPSESSRVRLFGEDPV